MTTLIFVGISVESDPEMTPRYQLGAVAYAFNADELDGFEATDFIATSTSQEVLFNNGIGIASSSPSTTANTLYNQGSVLYWNGSALAGGITNLTDLVGCQRCHHDRLFTVLERFKLG